MKHCPVCSLILENKKHVISFGNNPEFIGEDGPGCLFKDSVNECYYTVFSNNFFEKLQKFPENTIHKITCIDKIMHMDSLHISITERRKNFIPLSAWLLKHHVVNGEFLFSMIKTAVSHLNELNLKELQWQKLNINNILVLNHFIPEGETPLLFQPEFSSGDFSQTNESNLKEFARICLSFFDNWAEDRYADKLNFLLTFIIENSFEKSIELITSHTRLNSIEETEKKYIYKKVNFKNWLIYLIPIMFILSLTVSWLFSDNSDKPPQVEAKSEKILKQPPEINEVKVSPANTRWDKSFPFNYIDLTDDVYLFFNMQKEHCYQGVFQLLMKQFFNNEYKYCSPDVFGCFVSGSFSNRTWKTIIKKNFFQLNETDPWKSTTARISKFINKELYNPPYGVHLQLLNNLKYNPEDHSTELFLLFATLPSAVPPRNSIFNAVFGGIQPVLIAARGYFLNDILRIKLTIRFSTEFDAKSCVENARPYLETFLKKEKYFIETTNTDVNLEIQVKTECS
ncbi:MAG: hypothetical protein JXR95_08265 [Deltaproteobacteria bacterium]|nr:hypothetical protein [Deltaproteobacteria bacterium]